MVALGSPTALAGKLRSVLQNVESKWNVLLDSLNLKVFKSVRRTKAESGAACRVRCAHTLAAETLRPGPVRACWGRSIQSIAQQYIGLHC